MRGTVHAADRAVAAELRELVQRVRGSGELSLAHRRVSADDRGREHEVHLALFRAQARPLHVLARGHDAGEAARNALFDLAELCALAPPRHRVIVRGTSAADPARARVDKAHAWGFKPRHGPL